MGAGRGRRGRHPGLRQRRLRTRWVGPAGRRIGCGRGPRAPPGGRRPARRAPGRDRRCHGGSASHSGRHCFAWAGGRVGPGFAAQGNILAGAGVVDGLADTFIAGGRPFPELLVACLAAADSAGGDRRGRESAALLVVRADGGYGGWNDRWMDLRVDHHDDPIGELARLVDLQHLYFDRPLRCRPAAARRGDRGGDPVPSRAGSTLRPAVGSGRSMHRCRARRSRADRARRSANRARSHRAGTTAGSGLSSTGCRSRTSRSGPRRPAGSTPRVLDVLRRRAAPG